MRRFIALEGGDHEGDRRETTGSDDPGLEQSTYCADELSEGIRCLVLVLVLALMVLWLNWSISTRTAVGTVTWGGGEMVVSNAIFLDQAQEASPKIELCTQGLDDLGEDVSVPLRVRSSLEYIFTLCRN